MESRMYVCGWLIVGCFSVYLHAYIGRAYVFCKVTFQWYLFVGVHSQTLALFLVPYIHVYLCMCRYVYICVD